MKDWTAWLRRGEFAISSIDLPHRAFAWHEDLGVLELASGGETGPRNVLASTDEPRRWFFVTRPQEGYLLERDPETPLGLTRRRAAERTARIAG